MRTALILTLAISQSVSCWAEDDEITFVSPDGRFGFHAYSPEEADAGKPAFGILELASKRLVSDPKEPLGDATRPSEVIVWSPDSRSYALTTRVGSRHLDTFIYRWNGKMFQQAQIQGADQLEEWADEAVDHVIQENPKANRERRGATVIGDCHAERWLDPHRLILSRTEERLVIVGEEPDGSESGQARAIFVWDKKASTYTLQRRLDVAKPWPEANRDEDFTITQTDVPAVSPVARHITVKNAKSGETKEFSADGWMTAPDERLGASGWPQIELITHGPEEFLWRRLYRVENGTYACVRIDEMARNAFQAPEGAPAVEISPDYTLYLLRSWKPSAANPHPPTAFQVDFPSPDGKWKAVASYDENKLNAVHILDAAGKNKPFLLYQYTDDSGYINAVCQTLWEPGSQAIAFNITEGPRVSTTRVFYLTPSGWTPAKSAKINYRFLEEDEGKWQDQFEEPGWWNSNRELVLRLHGTKGDIDYTAHAILQWTKTWAPTQKQVTAVPVKPQE